MSKAVYISIVSLYIINMVRQIRRELGLSQREVSKIINPDTVSNLVGTIESIKGLSSYTDPQLHLLAKEFTAIALSVDRNHSILGSNFRKNKTEYSIHDFYPPEPVEDRLVEKRVVIFTKELHPTGALYTIIEDTDFLSVSHTVKEITDFVNLYFDKSWDTSDIGSPLDRAAAKGNLVKVDSSGSVTFKKSNPK